MATLACAQIKVDNAWVRATVPGQQATGAFMKITSIEAVKLSSVSSPAASISEIHEMKMDGGVMKMRALPSGLDIPANRAVELSSGGFHVMMMDLKQTISAGQSVPLELQFTNAKGHKTSVSVAAKAGFTDPYK
jgi:copper(I)-binding protein